MALGLEWGFLMQSLCLYPLSNFSGPQLISGY